jgi:hypothetical protein
MPGLPVGGKTDGMRKMITMTALAAALCATLLTSGCMEDAICGSEDYPVKAVGTTGSACVPEGQEPPAGYVRYPEGKVPQRVGDKWDEYWSKVVVDERGNVVPG